jgi:hypothetical protein
MAPLVGSYASYPAPPGDKRITMIQITGPASYTQISTGTPPTGGISVKASDLGLVEIEAILSVPTSNNGQFHLIPFPSASQLAPQKTVLFEAITTATGAQLAGASGSLAALTFIIVAIGN